KMDARGKRVVVGGLTVIAPKMMQVIETKPGKRPPFAELPADQRFLALLSFFDDAQWTKACSPQGIGLQEMNARERDLFVSLLPEKMVVQRSRVVAERGRTLYEDVGKAQEVEPLTAR